jgi:hypothetical protein
MFPPRIRQTLIQISISKPSAAGLPTSKRAAAAPFPAHSAFQRAETSDISMSSGRKKIFCALPKAARKQ